jgi:hypothetical protein
VKSEGDQSSAVFFIKAVIAETLSFINFFILFVTLIIPAAARVKIASPL